MQQPNALFPDQPFVFDALNLNRSSSAARLFRPPSTGQHTLARALRDRELGVIGPRSFHLRLYNSLVPNHTYQAVRHLPHVYPIRFTPCGRYFVTISENKADLVLYRVEGGDVRKNWPPNSRTTFASVEELRSERASCDFNRFFSLEYAVPLVNIGETLVAVFCLTSKSSRFLILASFSRPDAEAQNNNNNINNNNDNNQAQDLPAMRMCPIIERFTLYLVEVETGRVFDRFTLEKDFVQLERRGGIHQHGNFLCILALRSQNVYILRIQESMGRFVQERCVGAECNEDDKAQIAPFVATGQRPAGAGGMGGNNIDVDIDSETGLGNGKRRNAPYSGIMQRLLVYVFREYVRRGNAHKFFSVVANIYSLLLILRAQLIDDDHLLLELGPEEDAGREEVTAPHFFLVYCLSSTRIVRLFQDTSLDLLRIYERYHDFFYDSPLCAATEWRPPSADLIDSFASRSSRSDLTRRIRRALSSLPVRSSSTSPSPYLDRHLYSYDVERGSTSIPIKFTSVRTGVVRFRLRIATLPNAEEQEPATLLFHPTLPFAVSVLSMGVFLNLNIHTIGH